MSRHTAVGVIGHVDHGKTSLVKAISGIDTDRLREERERGMSIVLGFAWLDLGGDTVELIDVPGHENFVRTMVAGATGIDAALLVVDAMEGVMPQTVEHLAITELIGVQRGLVAVTKCDRAEPEVLAASLQRLRKLLKGTYLESAPLVLTSIQTGAGLEELKHELKGLCRQHPPPPSNARFYLPIDRAFSIPGRGTVVTGTLRQGRIRVGDEAELMPGGLRAGVRQLELHGRPVGDLLPGQRAGVNLRHVAPQQAGRGMALASPGLLRPSTLLDARLSLLNEQKGTLQTGQTVRLLFGTTDVLARVRLLSPTLLQPGESALGQLLTARPVAAVTGEAFILRTDSPPMTVGGGRFLDPVAARHRRSDTDALARLRVLERGTHGEVLSQCLKAAGYAGIGISALSAAAGISETQTWAGLSDSAAVMIDDAHVLYRPFLDGLADMMSAALIKFHTQYPARRGAPLSYCRSSLPRTVGDGVFRLVLRRLCTAKRIDVQDGVAARFGHEPLSALSETGRMNALAIEHRVKQGNLTPPDIEELLLQGEDRLELVHMLADRGSLLLLPGEHPPRKVVFHRDAVAEAARRMRAAFPPPTQFTVSELRALLGSTRKYIVPLLQHFDAAGYTRRHGDKRVVADPVEQGGE